MSLRLKSTNNRWRRNKFQLKKVNNNKEALEKFEYSSVALRLSLEKILVLMKILLLF
jgi:hypothetical protein